MKLSVILLDQIRGVNQLTGSSTGLSRKLQFLPTGISVSTFRRDENWELVTGQFSSLLDVEIPIPVGRKSDYNHLLKKSS